MTAQPPIAVDIWSDIACPWCYIGKRKFEAGLAEFREQHADAPAVEVTYHSFELSPDTPVDFTGSTTEFLAERKGMPVEQVEQMLERVTGIAASVGLDYDFDSVVHINTLRAHQVIHHAKAHGKQAEAKERLLRAYFVEGKNLSDVDELAALAAETGLDAEEVAADLRADRWADDVQADIAKARAYGIQGVPFFVLDEKYGISGAQESTAFAQALGQVATERGTDDATRADA
ncbi:DsbA family oxidoreductase [Georgenia sp. Z1344]|uniref:DsbA family oxidoreductase n=1 Tax=Georgenia sp. Z1344 TaxID=3416706 RepID=UPI003CEE446F